MSQNCFLTYFSFFFSYPKVCPDVKEVLDTFKVAAELGSDSLGAYVISMASNVWVVVCNNPHALISCCALKSLNKVIYFSPPFSSSLYQLLCLSVSIGRLVMCLLSSSCRRMLILLLLENLAKHVLVECKTVSIYFLLQLKFGV